MDTGFDDPADARRAQLAEAALLTLSENGYARTSVRDIAQKSRFSHGVLHYYFKDKTELIVHCIRVYKDRYAGRYDEVVASATTAEELLDAFSARLVESLVDEGRFHRLWYDIRTQGMYEPAYRHDVLETDALFEDKAWRLVSRYAALAGREVGQPRNVVYGCLDGMFQKALLDHLSGRAGVADQLAATTRGALPLFLGD